MQLRCYENPNGKRRIYMFVNSLRCGGEALAWVEEPFYPSNTKYDIRAINWDSEEDYGLDDLRNDFECEVIDLMSKLGTFDDIWYTLKDIDNRMERIQKKKNGNKTDE